LCKVSFKCHRSKCTIQDDPEKKINPNWIILSNLQPVIISRYLIEEEEKEEEEEEEEDEELVGEERDVTALVVKTETDPLSVLTLICKVGGPGAQRGGGSSDSKRGLVTEYTAYVASPTKKT
jgi:hypothetical protein